MSGEHGLTIGTDRVGDGDDTSARARDFGWWRRAVGWRLWLVVMGAGVVVVAMVVVGSGSSGCAEDRPGVRPGVCPIPVGARVTAPELSLPLLEDERQELSLRDFRGDIVVVNFWASWCGPCRAEQPDLNAVRDRFAADGVEFLGVDVQESSRVTGMGHKDEFSIEYPSLWDPRTSFAAQFEGVNPQTLPATIIVDRRGRVAVGLVGETTELELTVLLSEMLGSEPL